MTSTKTSATTSQLQDVPGMVHAANGMQQAHPKKFTVDVPDALMQDLKARLGTTRYPEQLAGAGWEMGTERTYLQDLIQYWRTDFSWPKQQRWLNSHFHNFKLEMDGINLHFVHHKSEIPDARPVLLIHGWPGSFIEFHAVIPKLTAAGYHVVAPSLPGYGFSSPPTRKGFGARQMAHVLDKLMKALGYDKYFCQGGDWGAIIGFIIGAKHSDSCKGLHTNMPLGEALTTSPWALAQWINASLPYLNKTPIALSAAEIRGLEQTKHFMDYETGYSKIQATKPQTLGYALNDSPTGLAAYITEKFYTWTDCDGHIENVISRDLLLTNISLYWFSGCITSSMRLYYESFMQREQTFRQLYCKTPTAASRFPKELYVLPKAWTAACYNLKQWKEHKRGGHFAALEQPDALVQDMLDFYSTIKL